MMVSEIRDISVRVRSSTIIKNLPPVDADISNSLLLSRYSIMDSSNISSLLSSSGNIGGYLNGNRDRSSISKIKNLLTDYSIPSQQPITITLILKYPIFRSENDQISLINIGNQSITIVQKMIHELIPI